MMIEIPFWFVLLVSAVVVIIVLCRAAAGSRGGLTGEPTTLPPQSKRISP